MRQVDHGKTVGLLDDDHTQYFLLAGRSGGQTLIGGTGAGNNLTFQTTSHVSKGSYIFSEMSSAGFLKNTSGGVVTGGGSIVDADVPDTITLANITQVGTRSHASLQNLSADDHTQYMLLAGRSGGQTLTGGTAAGDDLHLRTTSNVSKGTYYFDELTSNGFLKTGNSDGTVSVASIVSGDLPSDGYASTYVNVTGDTMTGTLGLDNESALRLYENDANGSNYVGLKAPAALSSDLTLTLNVVPGTCTGDANGGKLTVNGSNEIVCGNDNGGAGGGGDNVQVAGAAATDANFLEGLGIDLSLNTTPSPDEITVAFDPTELTGSRTWGDASTDTIVWTWDRLSSGDVAVTLGGGNFNVTTGNLQQSGNNVYYATGTDVPVTDGGTGASSASSARTNLGLAIGTDVQAYSAHLDDLADGTLTASKVGFTYGAGIGFSGSTISTASDEADFMKSGALTCGASTQGKAQVHTTPLQYCDNAATPTLQYAAYGNSSGAATSVADAELSALAGLTSAANKVPYFTGIGSAAMYSISATPGASTVPVADGSGLLDGWITLGASVDLSGAEATGTLAAGRFPALTGDITTSAGSLATTIGTDKVLDGMVDNTGDVKKVSFGVTIDGGGAAITTGVKGYVTIPWNMTLTGWDILADQSGSIVVDVWKDTYANYPPTVADTIAGTEKPTISAATKGQDTNLTSFSTSITAGDIIGFNVDSAATVTRVTLILYGKKV